MRNRVLLGLLLVGCAGGGEDVLPPAQDLAAPDLPIADAGAADAGAADAGSGDGKSIDLKSLDLGVDGPAPPFDVVRPTGRGAFGRVLAAGDLDGDGKLDLVSGSLDVSIGKGDGTFKTTTYAIPNVRSAALADLNGDGKLDLVLGLQQVSIAIGNGDGTFQTIKHTSDDANAPGASLLAVTDVDGDGKPDVLALLGNAVQLFHGNGDGTLVAAKSTLVDSQPPEAMAFADVDGDQILDAIAARGSAATVFLGDKSGGFTKAATLTSPTPGPARAVAAGDFDGDGHTDVAVATVNGYTTPGTVALFLGLGKGGFASPTALTVSRDPEALVARDLDGDGKSDLVVEAYGDRTTSAYLGWKGGAFQRFEQYRAAGSPALPGRAHLNLISFDHMA